MVKTLPSTVGGSGSVPGKRTKIPHVAQPKRIENNNQVAKKKKENKMINPSWGTLQNCKETSIKYKLILLCNFNMHAPVFTLVASGFLR